MKLSRERHGDRLRVVVRGAVEGASCDCLRHFWDAHCDAALAEIVVDLAAVDSIDAAGVASVRELVAESRARGARVTVVGRDDVDQPSPS